MIDMRCGFIGIVGAPNAGKSTLVNILTGEKVAIVSKKPNTTRQHIYGIVTEGNCQMILVDTPGLILAPEGPLQQYMSQSAWKHGKKADLCVVVIDAAKPLFAVADRMVKQLCAKKKRVWVVFNKVDLVMKENLLPLAARYQQMGLEIEKFFMISVRKQSGLMDLRQAMMDALPEGHWLFEEDALTQMSLRSFAAELTREKIFECLHQEVPYQLHVQTDLWYIPGQTLPPVQRVLPSSGISVFQTILVTKTGHRRLILGHGGQRIAHIGQKVRLELSDRLQKTVHLFLHVKVCPHWIKDPSIYRQMDSGV